MKAEVVDKLSQLITAAFGLVAALAWNGAIQSIFKQFFGEPDQLPAMILYGLIVTLIAVIITISLGRLAERAKNTRIPLSRLRNHALRLRQKVQRPAAPKRQKKQNV